MEWEDKFVYTEKEGMTKKKYVSRVNPHDTYNRCAELLISSIPPFYPFYSSSYFSKYSYLRSYVYCNYCYNTTLFFIF